MKDQAEATMSSPEAGAGLFRRLVGHPAWLEDRPVYVLALFCGLMAFAISLAAIFLFYVRATEGNATRWDFAAFWATAVMTLEGQAALAYDWDAHLAVQNRVFEEPFTSFMPWHYPPTFQLVVTPLGHFSLIAAQWVFTGITFALYLLTVRAIMPGRSALLIALVPATTFLVLVGGQTGFLTAALTGMGLLLWHRRPLLAAVPLGLMSLKPQLVLAVPIAVAAERRWGMLAAGIAVTVGFALVAGALLGMDTWEAFFESVSKTRKMFVTSGEIFHIYATPYGGLRYVGLDFGPALAVQLAISLALLVGMVRILRRPGTPPDLAAALIGYACIALSPRVLDYDLLTLFVAALFQVRHARAAGFFAGEKVILLSGILMTHLDAFTGFEANAILPVFLMSALLMGERHREPATAAAVSADGRAASGSGMAASRGAEA